MQPLRYRRILLVFSVLFLLAAACSLPTASPKPTPTNQGTAAEQTLQAMLTQVGGSSITSTPQASQSTATSEPDEPTNTPQPTWTRVVRPTNTFTPVCDAAGFVADISIPDGSKIAAGASFVKTWRLKNLGACTWTPDYAIVFESGSAMSGPEAQKIGASVLPGQVIDISLNLRAPGTPGAARGYYHLRNASGVLFGLGEASERFYVDINVIPAPAAGSGYDFTANVCLAQWTGSGKNIPCIGTDNSAAGFVLYQTRPILENGSVDDQPALLTSPPLITDGIIRGKYPAYTVKKNDRFVTIIGCEANAKNCDVIFQLDYQIDDGSIQTLATWHEVYEGNYRAINQDISSLAGKNVKFILTVQANGSANQDRALWLLPVIKNIAPPPTKTPTTEVTEDPGGYPYPYP